MKKIRLFACHCADVGCKYYGKDGKPQPICMTHNCADYVDDPDLRGRVAKCEVCSKVAPSIMSLPFFKWKNTKENDAFYCGCRGWE